MAPAFYESVKSGISYLILTRLKPGGNERGRHSILHQPPSGGAMYPYQAAFGGGVRNARLALTYI